MIGAKVKAAAICQRGFFCFDVQMLSRCPMVARWHGSLEKYKKKSRRGTSSFLAAPAWSVFSSTSGLKASPLPVWEVPRAYPVFVPQTRESARELGVNLLDHIQLLGNKKSRIRNLGTQVLEGEEAMDERRRSAFWGRRLAFRPDISSFHLRARPELQLKWNIPNLLSKLAISSTALTTVWKTKTLYPKHLYCCSNYPSTLIWKVREVTHGCVTRRLVEGRCFSFLSKRNEKIIVGG